jgi:ribosomal protein L40E
MALIDCAECNGQLSGSATSCPHCGYPVLRKRVAEGLKAASRTALSAVRRTSVDAKPDLPDDKQQLLFSRMDRPRPPWTLVRVNGCGLRLGKVMPVTRMDGYLIAVARLYFTVLFIPLVPLGWHVVREMDGMTNGIGMKLGSYQFIGRIDAATHALVFSARVAR